MTSTQVRPPQTPPGDRTAATASPRDDLVGVLLGAALIGGVLTDAWAHSNLLTPDSGFFTPWHALLYSGFAGTAAWTWWLAFRRRHEQPEWWRTAWPAGYRLGAAASLLFAVGGALDMLWHTLFGVEISLEAGLSPSHLILAAAGTLLVTSQLRSWWASGEGGLRAVTGVASAALGTVFATVVLSGMTAVNTLVPTLPYDPVTGEAAVRSATAQSVQSYLVGTVFLLIPLLLLHRRRATLGAAAAIVGGVGLFQLIQHEFPMPTTAAVIGMVLGAAVADGVVWWMDARRGADAPGRLPIAGAVFAAAIWSGHLIGLHLAAGIRWPVELWAGTVVITAVLSALIGLLATAPSRVVPADR
jgi:hypothetical protein